MPRTQEDIYLNVRGNDKHLRKTFKRIEKGFRKMDKQSKSMLDKFRGLDYAAISLGRTITRSVGMAFTKSMELTEKGVLLQEKFNESMAKMSDSAAMNPMAEQLKTNREMMDRLYEVAGKSRFEMQDLANAMEASAQSGKDTAQTFKLMEVAAKLAEGTNYGLNESMGQLMTNMAGFKLEAKDSGRAAAQIAKAVNSAYINMEDLGDTMKYASSVAKSANLDLEQVLGTVQFMGDIGIKGTMAGTAAKNIFLHAAGAAPGAAKKYIQAIKDQMQKEGVKFTMPNFTRAIVMSMKEMTKDEKIAKLTEMFGKRAVPAMLDVVLNPDVLNKFYQRVEDLQGTEYEYLDRLIGNIRQKGVGEYRMMMASADKMQTALGQNFAIAFAPVFKEMTGLFDSMTEFFRDESKMQQFGLYLKDSFGAMIAFFKDKENLQSMRDILILSGKVAAMILKIMGLLAKTTGEATKTVTGNQTKAITGRNSLQGLLFSKAVGAWTHRTGMFGKHLYDPANDPVEPIMKQYERKNVERARKQKHEYVLNIAGAPRDSYVTKPENDTGGLDIGLSTEFGY